MSTRHFVIATAGHVDHGKSALVKALTGTDPDRLPEEKARKITIELGFAELNLTAPNGQTIHAGIIDVPGHEGFIRNIVGGAPEICAAPRGQQWASQAEDVKICVIEGRRRPGRSPRHPRPPLSTERQLLRPKFCRIRILDCDRPLRG